MEEIEEHDPAEVKFENEDNFEFLIINPGLIDHIDYNSEGYINEVLKTIKIDKVQTNSKTFFNDISKSLNNDSLGSDDSQILKSIVHEEPNYIYEIFYLDIKTKEKIKPELFNGLASLINIDESEKHIFGNVVLIKTNLPDDDLKKVVFSNIDKNDIYNIMDSRVNTKVVYFEDGELREEKIYGEIEPYFKKLFGDDYYLKKEFAFLSHNLNIAYTHDDYGNELIPNLIKGKIDSAIFFTMKNDKFRGNLTLDELNQIIKLSNKLESFRTIDQELSMEEEYDNFGRKIIKNKFRVLKINYNRFFK